MNKGNINLDEISLRGICTDLVRSLLFIILAAAAMWLGATGAGRLTYTPQYTSSATVVVSAKGENSAYSSLSMANEMAGVFSEVFQSDALRERVAQDAGEDIQGTITCQAIEETNLLVLNAVSSDPRQAYLYINSALKNYEDVAGYVFSNASLEIVQEPQVPEGPSNVSRLVSMRNMLALSGAAVMAVIVILAYLFRFTVKNTVSASRQLDGTIQGVIPFEKKNGIKKEQRAKQALLLSSPLVSMGFAEASRKAQARIEHHMKKRGLKVLQVASISENEGKSTVAANIALALAEKHKKVLFIDGDLHKPAQFKIFSKRQPGNFSLEDVLRKKADWRDAVIHDRKDQLYQIFQFHGIGDSSGILDMDRLTELMKEWREEMDYIVIDSSPAAVSTDSEVWMQLADTVLLVVRQDWSDVRMINDTVDLVWQSGTDFAGFILNAFKSEWAGARREYGYSHYTAERTYTAERNQYDGRK